MKVLGKSLAAMVAAATLMGGGAFAVTGTAFADDSDAITVTPNPWYSNNFDGWGTSLAWFANATGSYGEEGAITRNLGDAESEKKALEYGKQLREQFYQSIFGANGLDLNMARYNVGGGNASDVAYGYPFMRQGAAVPGTWKDDPTGSGTYGAGVTTNQADKDKLAAAFDPTDDSQYDFSKAAAQDWWVKRGAETGDITNWEAFSNSAPWFLTNSGYATGSYNAADNNLKDPQKFAQYMAKNVEYLEKTYGINVNTVEPFNESETNYWPTPTGKASDSYDANNTELINRYWDRYYQDKDKSVTPYTTAVKKPQEGSAIGKAQQLPLINALNEALKGNEGTVVSATDASVQSQFVDSYNNWLANDPSIVTEKKVGQYNVHSYGSNAPRQVRDIAQGDDTRLSMSEVDGDFSGQASFNPYNFNNATGIAPKINTDIYNLQSQDWTFWQVVEDLYNMSTPSNSSNNPVGENLNWGTVFIDFDCTVAGKDGKLYSERRIDNNNGTTDGLAPCSVVVNSKYNAARAYTKFVQKGDYIIANNSTNDNLTASSADGNTQTVIHTNSGSKEQKLVIDLSKYKDIADNASGKLFLTTAPEAQKDAYAATPEYMNKYSNQEQAGDAVVIDKAAKTATVTVPAKSIASIQLTGVSGVADTAEAIKDGASYQLAGQQSGKVAQVGEDGSLTIENTAADAKSGKAQSFTFHQVAADPARPTLKKYVISNADGTKVLGADGTFVDGTVDAAKSDATKIWILNTEDGSYYSLVNASAKKALEVDGSKTAAGSKISLYVSNGGKNQAWSFRSTTPTGIKAANAQTPVNGTVTMPKTVTPYYTWGAGAPVEATWDTSAVDTSKAGTYTVKGSATDIFGNSFDFEGSVYVGPFTVVDPVSATVLAGTSADDAEAALKAAPVYAHVGASEAVAADAFAVTWYFDGFADKLAAAKAGESLAVSGTFAADGKSLDVHGTVYVVAAEPENVADTASNLIVTGQQTEYGKGDQWRKLTDGDTSAEAWVTWNSANDYSASPTATVNFGEQRDLDSVTITYGDKAPASAKAEYTTDGKTWTAFGSEVKPASGQTVTFKADKGTVDATQVRIVNTVNNDYMNATEIQAFVTPVSGGVKNIAAASGTNFSVNFQEGSTGSKAIDGDTAAKGWSTWASTASTIDPVATFEFEQPQTITEVKTFFYRDGRASWPKSQTLEYQDETGAWKTVGTKDGWYVQKEAADDDDSTAADTPAPDFKLDTPVVAKAIRLTNTLQDTKVYINVAEIQVFAQDNKELVPQPSADATLGDLRLDGETIKGFDPAKTDYTVDLPIGAEANPVLQAFASDNAATVTVKGDVVEAGKLGGKAAITVTSADKSATKDYTVTFNAAKLASLKVTGPSKTEYAVGDKLDTAGLKVSAVYQRGEGESATAEEVPIALDDPQLVIGAFDSTTAGKKTVTVTYRGVTGAFEVTVKANAVAPGPQQPQNPNQPGGSNGKPVAKPSDGKGSGNVLTATGASVAVYAGAAVALAVAAGVLFLARKRRD